MTEATTTTDASEPKRPAILAMICVVLFLGAMMAMQFVVSDEFRAFPATFRYIYIGMVLLTPVSVLGIFLMRRWGVILYVLVTVVGQVVQIIYGTLNPVYLVLSVLIIAVCFIYYREMR